MANFGDSVRYEEGSAIKGEKIAYSCRKLIEGDVSKGSGKHRAQFGKMYGSAYCIVEKKFKQIP